MEIGTISSLNNSHKDTPRPIDTPGVETFKGAVLRSQRYDQNVDIEVRTAFVCIALTHFRLPEQECRRRRKCLHCDTENRVSNDSNGYAIQLTSLCREIAPKVKSLTQFARGKQWFLPKPHAPLGHPVMRWMMENIPGLKTTFRALVFGVVDFFMKGELTISFIVPVSSDCAAMYVESGRQLRLKRMEISKKQYVYNFCKLLDLISFQHQKPRASQIPRHAYPGFRDRC